MKGFLGLLVHLLSDQQDMRKALTSCVSLGVIGLLDSSSTFFSASLSPLRPAKEERKSATAQSKLSLTPSNTFIWMSVVISLSPVEFRDTP